MWKLILVIDQINKANLQTCQRICIRNKKHPLNNDSCYYKGFKNTHSTCGN